MFRVDLRLIDCQAEAQAEFGVVLKQRVGPGGSPPVFIGAVGGCRQVGAVD